MHDTRLKFYWPDRSLASGCSINRTVRSRWDPAMAAGRDGCRSRSPMPPGVSRPANNMLGHGQHTQRVTSKEVQSMIHEVQRLQRILRHARESKWAAPREPPSGSGNLAPATSPEEREEMETEIRQLRRLLELASEQHTALKSELQRLHETYSTAGKPERVLSIIPGLPLQATPKSMCLALKPTVQVLSHCV